MAWLRWALFVWIAVCPITVVNLYQVRNSGIYFPVLALSVLLVLVALRVLLRPSDLPWRSRLTVPLLALAIAAVAAGIQGAVLYDSNVPGEHRFALVQIYAVALVVLSVGASFVVSVLARTLADLLWIRRALVAIAAVVLVDELLRLGLRHDGTTWMAREVTGWWPMVNAHAASLVLACVLFEPFRRMRAALGAVFIAISVLEVVVIPFVRGSGTQWLSGWIATAVPIALLILVRAPRATLAVAAPALAGLLWWQYPLLQQVYTLAVEEGDMLRLFLWEDAARIASMRPFLGVGPGNYLDYVMRYGNLTIRLSSPHGNYQQIAAEIGLLGLGFALWLFGRALQLGWRLFRRGVDARIRSLAIGATCSLAGVLAAAFVGDFVLPNYHNGGHYHLATTVYAWVMIGLLMSLERLALSPRRDGAVSAGDGGP